jgi:hypothetical protein
MKPLVNTLLMAAVLATTGVPAKAAVRAHSKTILVESPSQLPVLAENGGEAMYLYDTGDGRTILYLEIQGGRELSALDVTDPAKITAITQTKLATKTLRQLLTLCRTLEAEGPSFAIGIIPELLCLVSRSTNTQCLLTNQH